MSAGAAHARDGERRRHRRYACMGDAEVIAFDPRLLFRGRVRDISCSGCFIETGARLALSRMAEVELVFHTRGVEVRSLARVMDVQPGRGAGFEFLPGDPRRGEPFFDLIRSLDRETEPVEVG